jgi:Na+/melibiose symporter-like transporter
MEYITTEVHIILFIYVVNKTGQELIVSSMPLLMKANFQWSDENIGYYMALVGGLVLPANILVNSLVKDAEERDTMLKLIYLSLISNLLICYGGHMFGDYSLFQYVLGTCLLFITLNAIEGVNMSLLSKLISPELAKGTFNSGLLATEAGTLGRVMGDMMITIFGSMHYRHNTEPTTSTTADDNGVLVNQLYLPLVLLIMFTLLFTHRFYDTLID